MLDAVVIAQLDLAPLFSAPLLFGGDVSVASASTPNGFYFGFRPEILATWSYDRRLGFGIGPYANAIDSTGTSQVWLGGGLTLAGYFGKLNVALSGGVDCVWLNSVPSAVPVLGGFVGFRIFRTSSSSITRSACASTSGRRRTSCRSRSPSPRSSTSPARSCGSSPPPRRPASVTDSRQEREHLRRGRLRPRVLRRCFERRKRDAR